MAILGRGITGLPLDTDSLIVGVGGVLDELEVGTLGQVLTVTAGGVAWDDPATVGSGTITSVNGDTGPAVSLDLNDLDGVSVPPTPGNNFVLAFNTLAGEWQALNLIPPGGGEANDGENVSAVTSPDLEDGAIFSQKNGVNLQFRVLREGVSGNLDISRVGDDIFLDVPNVGEVNTLSNDGTVNSISLVGVKSGPAIGIRGLREGANITLDDTSQPGEVIINATFTPPVTSVNGEVGAVILDLDNLDGVDVAGPNDGEVLTFDSGSGNWIAVAPPGAGGGEVNDGLNLGTGSAVFFDKNGLNLRFRTITGVGGVLVSEIGNEVVIDGSSIGGTVTSVGLQESGANNDFTIGGSPVTTSGNLTLALNTTGVSAGTYNFATITVDDRGRISSASTGNGNSLSVASLSLNDNVSNPDLNVWVIEEDTSNALLFSYGGDERVRFTPYTESTEARGEIRLDRLAFDDHGSDSNLWIVEEDPAGTNNLIFEYNGTVRQTFNAAGGGLFTGDVEVPRLTLTDNGGNTVEWFIEEDSVNTNNHLIFNYPGQGNVLDINPNGTITGVNPITITGSAGAGASISLGTSDLQLTAPGNLILGTNVQFPQSIGTPTQILAVNAGGTALEFVNAPSGSGATDLNGLNDVTLSGVASGNYLRYSGLAWVNAGLDISDDSTPALGGNLAVGANFIQSNAVLNLDATTEINLNDTPLRNVEEIGFVDGGSDTESWFVRENTSEELELAYGANSGSATIRAAFQPGSSLGWGHLEVGSLIIRQQVGPSEWTINEGSPSSPLNFNYDGGTRFAIFPDDSLLINSIQYNFPGADAAGVLTSDGAGNLTWNAAGAGLMNVVDDTTPQLGGDLDAQNFTINNLADPTTDDQAATKNYVDTEIAAIVIPVNTSDLVNDSGFITSTLTQDLDAGGNAINNLADPTTDNQAATKSYVDLSLAMVMINSLDDIGDVAVSGASNSDFLMFDGVNWVPMSIPGGGDLLAANNLSDVNDTQIALNNLTTGNVINGLMDPTTGDQAATKSYVDQEIAAAASAVVSVNGNTGAVSIGLSNLTDYDANGNALVNLADPTTDQDAATKAYVDSEIASVMAPVTSVNGLTGVVTIGASNLNDYDFGGNALNNLADPTTGNQAATKDYVDSEIVALNLGTASQNNTGDFATAAQGALADSALQSVSDDTSPQLGGALDANNNVINNLADPTTGNQAATKDYIDNEIASIDFPVDSVNGLTDVVVIGLSNLNDYDAGGNALVNLADPTTDQDAATKAYVDQEVASAAGAVTSVNGQTGATTVGLSNLDDYDAGGNTLNNLADPTTDDQAATKAYVDANAGGGTRTVVLAFNLGIARTVDSLDTANTPLPSGWVDNTTYGTTAITLDFTTDEEFPPNVTIFAKNDPGSTSSRLAKVRDDNAGFINVFATGNASAPFFPHATSQLGLEVIIDTVSMGYTIGGDQLIVIFAFGE